MIKENIMEKIGWVEERNSEKLPEVRKSHKRLLNHRPKRKDC